MMKQKLSLAFLRRLMASISPSGYEREASELWLAEARRFTRDVWRDQHGNSFARLNRGAKRRVMLAGHLDEIGFLVSYIDPDGFIYFVPVGGWDPQVVQGQRVWVRGRQGRIDGVIGKKPIHLIRPDERDRVVKLDSLWIDIGAANRKEAEARVAIGDPVVLAYEMAEWKNGLLVSRAMDDKIGAFVVLEAARRLAALPLKIEVVAVATVQEEIGLRGATTSAFALEPHAGIAVDVTFATDTPGLDAEKRKEGEVRLGRGPVISRGPNINHVLFDLLCATADKHKIARQIVAEPTGTGTDANEMQLSRSGVATALLSVPNRYMHSPCEMVRLDDVEAAVDLLTRTVAAIKPNADFAA